MREKQLPVNENVFNALIMGHSFADDMESAAGIIAVMSQAGLDPSADTYTILLSGYARKGDIESINKYIKLCEEKEIHLLDKDFLEVCYALAINGHSDKVDAVLNNIKKTIGYNQDAVNVILRLINKGQETSAMKVLKTMPRSSRVDGGLNDAGNFLIKQLIKASRPIEQIIDICNEMEQSNMNSKPIMTAVEAALTTGNTKLAPGLLKEMLAKGYEVRQHYFWPVICSAKNDDEIISILHSMRDDFDINPSAETIREYIVPNLKLKDLDAVIGLLRNAGISLASASTSTSFHALTKHDMAKAADIMTAYDAFYSPALFSKPLVHALAKTMDYKNYIKIVRQIYDSAPRKLTMNQTREVEQDEESESLENASPKSNLKANILGQIVLDAAIHFKVNRVEVLQNILAGLVEQGLTISSSKAELIQERIGESMTTEMSTMLGKLTTGELEPAIVDKQRTSRTGGIVNMDVAGIERLIQRFEEKGENTKPLKRQLLVSAIRSKNIEKTEAIVERLKAEGYILTSGVYAQLIDLYASADNLEKAVEVFDHIKKTDTEFSLDDVKTIKIAQLYVNQDRVEDAVKFLEANKRENIPENRPFNYNSTCWRLLNSIAEKGNSSELNMVFDALVASNYILPNNVLLGPLIKVHLIQDELTAAVDKFEEICRKYRSTPWKNEIACRLIQKEDATNLQRLTDLSTEIHGEVNSLYDLVFSFVECGRVRQARKILETPGLRTRPGRINTACERYLQEQMPSALEGLVEATKDLNHIDRAEIYYTLLQTYIKDASAEKALGLWTKMQEEDTTPSDLFLAKLAELLKSQNIEVPFTVPEITTAPVEAKVERKSQPVATSAAPISDTLSTFRTALKAGDIDEILNTRQNLQAKDKVSLMDKSLILEALVKSGRLNQATNLVFELLQQNMNPIPRIFRFYLNKLAATGDSETIERIGQLLNDDQKKVLSFDNRFCHSFISGGKADEYLKQLEMEIDGAVTEQEIKKIGEKFPRGGAVGILERKPEFTKQFEVIAMKYAEKGLLGPVNVLWMHYFINNKTEESDALWSKYLSASPRLMFQRVVHYAREKSDANVVQRLINLLRDAKVSEGAVGNAYSCLLDIHSQNNDADACLKTIDESIKDVCLENINKTALLRVKDCVEKAGKQFTHKIPERTTNAKKQESSSSSSSSSSDDEVVRKEKL